MSEPVVITAKNKGPLLVQGPCEIRDQDGQLLDPPPAKQPGIVKLCGCGHSKTKPFCDGTHKELA